MYAVNARQRQGSNVSPPLQACPQRHDDTVPVRASKGLHISCVSCIDQAWLPATLHGCARRYPCGHVVGNEAASRRYFIHMNTMRDAHIRYNEIHVQVTGLLAKSALKQSGTTPSTCARCVYELHCSGRTAELGLRGSTYMRARAHAPAHTRTHSPRARLTCTHTWAYV